VARPDGNFYERTLWVMDLFENLAERRRPALDNRQRGANASANGLQLEAAE
jgi:hypothetical protein